MSLTLLQGLSGLVILAKINATTTSMNGFYLPGWPWTRHFTFLSQLPLSGLENEAEGDELGDSQGLVLPDSLGRAPQGEMSTWYHQAEPGNTGAASVEQTLNTGRWFWGEREKQGCPREAWVTRILIPSLLWLKGVRNGPLAKSLFFRHCWDTVRTAAD